MLCVQRPCVKWRTEMDGSTWAFGCHRRTHIRWENRILRIVHHNNNSNNKSRWRKIDVIHRECCCVDNSETSRIALFFLLLMFFNFIFFLLTLSPFDTLTVTIRSLQAIILKVSPRSTSSWEDTIIFFFVPPLSLFVNLCIISYYYIVCVCEWHKICTNACIRGIYINHNNIISLPFPLYVGNDVYVGTCMVCHHKSLCNINRFRVYLIPQWPRMLLFAAKFAWLFIHTSMSMSMYMCVRVFVGCRNIYVYHSHMCHGYVVPIIILCLLLCILPKRLRFE